MDGKGSERDEGDGRGVWGEEEKTREGREERGGVRVGGRRAFLKERHLYFSVCDL